MQKIVSFIPHLFTLGNLFCGCLGIIYAFNNRLDAAFYMVMLAAFLDFFDGFFARILKVAGELGKQLDSLADAVSFGVLPAIVMFLFVNILIRLFAYPCFSLEDVWASGELLPQPQTPKDCFFVFDPVSYHPLSFIVLLIAPFSVFRLAKFNIDTRQNHGFIGLPTPANAIFICSIVFSFFYSFNYYSLTPGFHSSHSWTIYPPLSARPELSAIFSYFPGIGYDTLAAKGNLFMIIYHPFTMIGISLAFCFLLVSPIPLFALKFKNFGWNDNKIRYIFLALAAVLLICFWFLAIPFIVILYIILSIVNNILKLTV